MNAIVLTEAGLRLQEIPSPDCPAGHVRIRLLAAALNHRDQYIREGKYAKIVLPCVLGSDGVGVVTEAPCHPSLLGQRVVMYPAMGWGDDLGAQGPLFSILGMPTQGTLAEEVVVPAEQVFPAPTHLTNEQAAALPLAGLTAYRALIKQGALQSGQSVLVTGIGGGVATTILLFAAAVGARVGVTSRSAHKIERAIALGASRDVETFDLALDSIGGETVNALMNSVRAGGRIVFYGASQGAVPQLNLHRLYWKQIHLVGSTMGTREDFIDMLRFVAEKKIVPVVDRTFLLADAVQAFDRLHAAEQFGKIVVLCN